MKNLFMVLLAGFLTLHLSAAYGAQPRTEQEWEKCRDKVFASRPTGYYGAGGRGALGTILKKCGAPVQKTKLGYVVFKNYCNGIYQNTLSACHEASTCDGVEGLSMASHSWLALFSDKTFDIKNFDRLCKQVCQTRKMPDRTTFGNTMCGES